MPVLAAIALALQTPDPENLPIGPRGTVEIHRGLTNALSGKSADIDQIAAACDNVSFVLVGEQHATPAHHQLQADIVDALIRRGRHVAVGVEYFTRDNQLYVNGLSVQQQTVDEFENASSWKTQWGHPFDAYRPLWETVRKNRLPVVALNVPRAWVSQASRQGYESFDAFQKSWVPSLDLSNKEHRMIFDALLGGHPAAMGDMDIYRGQVTWDTGMAQSAIEWKRKQIGSKPVMVICAGIGHVMYGQAINYRLKQLGGYESRSVVCLSGEPRQVSRGIGDWIFLSP